MYRILMVCFVLVIKSMEPWNSSIYSSALRVSVSYLNSLNIKLKITVFIMIESEKCYSN